MKIFPEQQSRHGWQKRPICNPEIKRWLIDTGSLTARLRARYADFTVQPVVLRYARPLRDEVSMLGLKRNEYALIREVLLIGSGQPVVFAHSVLPGNSLNGQWRGLGKLGNRPLGAALFANPRVKRTPLEYKKLSPCSPISMRVSEHAQIKGAALWARRSVFKLGCARILVTEVFLPHILAA
ncbi:MAG TPA: chorismate lyase [Methylophilus sp.]|nr:chorismate lyase [Methylophilus sp.]HQQ32284.1 chorismate lyase [Methylophilus sp.]